MIEGGRSSTVGSNSSSNTSFLEMCGDGVLGSVDGASEAEEYVDCERLLRFAEYTLFRLRVYSLDKLQSLSCEFAVRSCAARAGDVNAALYLAERWGEVGGAYLNRKSVV